MDKAKRYTPFCNWVPKPLGAAVLLFLFVPLMFAGGTYLTNVAEMVGATGAWPEDYQLASSCAFIGMSVFFPFMVGYLQARSVKAVYVWGLALLVLINLVMPRAESVVVQCLLCLVLGFIRVMLVLNTTFTLAPYLFGVDTLALFTMKTLPDAPAQYAIDHQRSVLVVCLYVLLMSLIEWSNYVVAWVAYTYQWAYSYTLVNILLGAALLLVLLGGAALAVCQWLIFFYAPVEAQLGLMQKVFYTHLPLAWWALISFLVVFVASIVYLIRRSPAADRVCAAAAEVGVLLAGLALVTGMIWARRSWGVWWTWDPRLTTTLVMWFIYAGYLVLRGLDLPPQRKRMICAVVGVVAFLDVPLVFLSARLWRSIHPAVFASKGGGLEPEMKLTAIACVAAMGLFWAGLVWLRTRQLGLRDRLDSLRLQAED